jgi:transposase
MYYSEDLRKKTVEYLQREHTQKETCEVFNISPTTIKRWKKQYQETGSLKNKPLNRSYKKIDPEKLSVYVKGHPDAYLKEIAEVFCCTGEAVRLTLKKLKITLKKRQRFIGNAVKKSDMHS